MHCLSSIHSKGILAANCAVTVRDNAVPIRLFNGTNERRTINKGERIATFTTLEDESDAISSEPVYHTNDSTHLSSCGINVHREPDIDWSKAEVAGDDLNKLKSLVSEFSDCFVDPITKKLGLTDLTSCKIDTFPDAVPVQKYPYRMAPSHREEMNKIVSQQLEQQLIEEAKDGAWASPALLVKKASGGFRLVVDYRALNAATIPQVLRVPRLDDVLDSVGETNPQYFTVLDCTQGFHQIPLDPESRSKTGFITPMGKFRYKTMPQGIKNAPATFQALMDTLLRGVQYKYVAAYIDDIILFSHTFEQHLAHIREVLERLRNAKLKLHPKKCLFAVKRVGFLGHILKPQGISPDPDKIEAIKDYPIPKKLKHVRGFLGLSGFYRRFISNFAHLAKPLYNLTKKDVPFNWTPDCQEAFDKLKAALTSESVLAFPDFQKPFVLATDASKTGIGACLSQVHDGQLKPVGFAGRGFTKAESNYTTTEQELLGVVFGIQHFRVYLTGNEFELHTDHSALRWILGLKEPQGRLARWVTFLQQFQYKVSHVKGKDNVVPDALSRRPYDVTRTFSRVVQYFRYEAKLAQHMWPRLKERWNAVTDP